MALELLPKDDRRLNALVGTSVLPTGVVPVTAVVTILRYGPILHAEVHFENGSRQHVEVQSIADYVSEELPDLVYTPIAVTSMYHAANANSSPSSNCLPRALIPGAIRL